MASSSLLAVPPSRVHGGDDILPSGGRDNSVVGVSHEAGVGGIGSFLVTGFRESGFGDGVILRHEDEMDGITNRCFNLTGCVDQSTSTTNDDLC